MRQFLPLLHYLRPQSGFLGVIALLTLITSLLAALQPWPMKLARRSRSWHRALALGA